MTIEQPNNHERNEKGPDWEKHIATGISCISWVTYGWMNQDALKDTAKQAWDRATENPLLAKDIFAAASFRVIAGHTEHERKQTEERIRLYEEVMASSDHLQQEKIRREKAEHRESEAAEISKKIISSAAEAFINAIFK